MIFIDPASSLGEVYPRRPAKLRHRLADGPLFKTPRILDLARRLPANLVEYYCADLEIGDGPRDFVANGLSLEETIERIGECRSWVVLKNVETDPDYRALMEECLADIAPCAGAATGAMHRREAFLLLSSPGAVTPFHMDPEHNILLQIRGAKTMRIYPSHDYSIVTPEQHERFHEGGHRSLEYREAFEAVGENFDLAPGEAVYVPVKTPHHVRVAGEPSLSLSLTWRSRSSDADARLHRMNHLLRRLGARPLPPGDAPARDKVKIFAHRIYAKLRRAAKP